MKAVFGALLVLLAQSVWAANGYKIEKEKSLGPCDNCMDKPCTKENDFWDSRSACPVKKELRYEQEFISYLIKK